MLLSPTLRLPKISTQWLRILCCTLYHSDDGRISSALEAALDADLNVQDKCTL